MAGQHDSKGFIRTKVQSALSMDDQRYLTFTDPVKHFFSEMFGTGLLVFLGCMGVRTGDSHLGVCFSFGISAFIAIQICCHNSGGHVNPTVTLVAIIFKKMSLGMGAVYILGQTIGGILGYGLLLGITPNTIEPSKTCVTIPHGDLSDFQAFAFEAIMTGVLCLVVCSIWDPRNGALLDSATVKFGLAIFALAFAGGAYTGCSMNPARSFGPAVWQGHWDKHWVYWIGPVCGALIASIIYKTFFCAALRGTSRETKVEMETIATS